ncbi:DUF4175 domain-containing protein [Hymenobacter sp. 15J16-1T3B]|uniref:DUF4175 domain-containing protein n=1 Tax=Hymenobacter sp. 15J16-1T3B TaxID=2886941 RepID=UPI001D1154B6|nr:DUF4175 domain-containing protein [Hymenobacter sp. 15J16-1T3B]MCC3155893.1 DUF4175 domain-containing protein [Hymenobacter sp. 15J16-1T3B]
MTTTTVSSASLGPARQVLQRAWQRYRWQCLATLLLLAAAGGGALYAAYRHWANAPLLAGIAAASCSLLLAALWPLRHVDAAWAARRFDRQFPELEDSTGLLLTEPSSMLSRLQQQRVADRLLQLHNPAAALPAPWRVGLAATLVLALLGAALWPRTRSTAPSVVSLQPHFTPEAGPAATAAPRLRSTQVLIVPPAYTRQPAAAAAQLSFRCPQGALVRWTLHLSRRSAPPQLLLAGKAPVLFRAVAGQPATYVAEFRFTRSTLYRLLVAGRPSDDYAVDVQPDAAPTLRLLAPRPYTLIERQQSPAVAVRTELRDDYGLTRARLVVTTAQGSGEAVKFREVVMDLSATLRGQPRQQRTTTTLRLPALGLTYGDELYVYAEAWDAAGHRARTDAALVQWQDTAATADDVAAISLGVNQMPAYFRSQRQIIIDTEKLLAQRRRLSAAEFRARANSLGDDQKILRLRYGKFLGEEGDHTMTEAAEAMPIAEDGAEPASHAEADEHDHPAPPTAEGGLPTAESLLTPYQHLHDDAETADFLEPQVKAKLRAVLSQMWDAELRLRLAQLPEALPYENRALRLLKQVQQQTRLYVRKSGVELPPLPEVEKRLTGDLSKTTAPHRQGQQPVAETQAAIRRALPLLAAYRAGQRPAPADARRLQPAGQELGLAALREPGAALPALRAWRRLLAQVQAARPVAPADLEAVERALTQLLPAPTPTPQRPAAAPLARRYFQELRR